MLYEPSAAAGVWRVNPVAVFRTVICAFGGALPRNAASTACVQPARGAQASTTRRAAASLPNPFFTQTNIVPLVSWSSSTNPARQYPQEAFPSHRGNQPTKNESARHAQGKCCTANAISEQTQRSKIGPRTHRLLQWLRTHRPGGQVPAGSPVHPPAIALPLLRVEYLSHVAHHCEACYTGARIYGGCAGEFQ